MKNPAARFYPKCAASGIGSLPALESRSAVKSVFKYVAEIPFWPQLPKRDYREGMLLQFSENFMFLDEDNHTLVLKEDWNNRLEFFFERIINKELDFFAVSENFALGLHDFFNFVKDNRPDCEFLKGQITGPFTFSSPIKAADGNSLLFDEQLLDAVVSGLAMKAAWQIRKINSLGKKAILFIDEPYLACFGSGFTPINREKVIEIINRLIETIAKPEALIGLHCCSNTDWSMLLETNIDIVSFDAFSYLERFTLYPEELKRFFAKGGTIAWGIVPTTEFDPKISVQDLIAKFQEGLETLEKKGLDKKDIIYRALITPSCGMGSLSTEVSESVLELLCETSKQLKHTFDLS